MAKNVKDLCVKIGEWTDGQGVTKPRWKTIGVAIENDKGGWMLSIERTFNPAGMPVDPKYPDTCIINMFDKKAKDGVSTPHKGMDKQGDYAAPTQMDDEIPFNGVVTIATIK